MRRVQVGRVVVSVDSGEWVAIDGSFAGRMLAKSIDAVIDLWGERDYLPDSDLILAKKAARAFGGKVLEEVEEIGEPIPPDLTM